MQPTEAVKILSDVLNAATQKGVFSDLKSAAITFQALNILVNATSQTQNEKTIE